MPACRAEASNRCCQAGRGFISSYDPACQAQISPFSSTQPAQRDQTTLQPTQPGNLHFTLQPTQGTYTEASPFNPPNLATYTSPFNPPREELFGSNLATYTFPTC